MRHSRLEKTLRKAAEIAISLDRPNKDEAHRLRLRISAAEGWCSTESRHLADSLEMIRTGKTLAGLEAERLARLPPKLTGE